MSDTTTNRKPNAPFPTVQAIADAARVTWHAAGAWVKDPEFPKKGKRGWPAAAVWEWIDKRNEERDARAERAGDRDEKVRLECEKLRVVIQAERERLEQARIETARAKGEVWLIADVLQEWGNRNQAMRAALESWRRHASAKHRTVEAKRLIDELCDGMLACIHESFSP